MIVEFPPLLESDRCDRCPAQARAMSQHNTGLLYWCLHHFRLHREELEKGVAVSCPKV